MTNLFNSDKLKFNEKNHTYKVGKKRLEPVSSFVKRFFPFDAKAKARELAKLPWAKAQKKGVRYWLAQWAKNAEDGTETHKQIEEYITEHRDLLDVEDQKAQVAMNYYEELKRKVVEPICKPEARVYSEELGLAGTIDLIISHREEGKRVITLVDWKTNKEIRTTPHKEGEVAAPPLDYPNANQHQYMLQLATYAYILEKEYDVKVKELQIVHLRDNAKRQVYSFDYGPMLAAEVEKMINEVKKNESK